ncbi:MAG: ATP-binding cassette domain-containing protein, partial [Verrucomicrobiota bacterium]
MRILIDDLSKIYGSQSALRNLNLDLGPDLRKLVLIGPSGGGKSTLLKILGGLEPATSGQVQLNEVTLTGETDEETLRHHRRANGFLFQSFNLFPHLTAL